MILGVVNGRLYCSESGKGGGERGLEGESIWVIGTDGDNVEAEAGAAAGKALPWQGDPNRPVPRHFHQETAGANALCLLGWVKQPPAPVPAPPRLAAPLYIYPGGNLPRMEVVR